MFIQTSGYVLKEIRQHLSGEAVLYFVHKRHDPLYFSVNELTRYDIEQTGFLLETCTSPNKDNSLDASQFATIINTTIPGQPQDPGAILLLLHFFFGLKVINPMELKPYTFAQQCFLIHQMTNKLIVAGYIDKYLKGKLADLNNDTCLSKRELKKLNKWYHFLSYLLRY